MTTVLVTGGAGYIGAHACKALARAGYTPVTYDSLVHGHADAVRWGPLEQGDISDRARLDAVLAQWRPAAVMHFAAYAYVGESVENPGKYWRNNVAGTLTLLEALRDHGIGSFVFSSTCATYGVPQRLPLTEDHPQHPINPYGMTKLAVERMLADFDAAHGLRSISLRYFNAAGADPDGETGESHDPETHLIPLVLDAAAGRRAGITVYGSDYPTPDGTCVRDYIHVSDLAEAHVLALRALLAGAGTTAYNLGNGRGFSVREVIDCARSVTGRQIAETPGPRRPGDPPVLVGDAGRIRSELGWAPKHVELAAIVGTAWRWHQSRHPDPA
ncbi:UDP-glucose 4-epimerase GalE [Thermomonas sp.]|uniref:UDP-glucose 4-epimerase GalE n=1 Tax=Thermomonas sp. TaxID=1971895 RepID=UPI00260556A9|nr:UDP-glucose 4-epimerase GalE [Thermomonas sp.]